MNKFVKTGISALALVAATSVYAFSKDNGPLVETVPEEDGVVGWTPIAFGLATPVQLPWGLDRWDVFGLDLNILYADAPKMYGLMLGGLGSTTRDRMCGIQIGGLATLGFADVYGLRLGGVANYARDGVVKGLDVAGLAGIYDKVYGVQIAGLGSFNNECHGLGFNGLANISHDLSYGAMISGLGNYAKTAYGFQAGLFFNMTYELHGCQFGLVNYAQECAWGFQIGLVNIIMDNAIKVLPVFNAYF